MNDTADAAALEDRIAAALNADDKPTARALLAQRIHTREHPAPASPEGTPS